MKFYIIQADINAIHNHESHDLLKKAAEARGYEVVLLDAATFDYSQKLDDVLEDGSCLYRVAVNPRAKMLESLIFKPTVATLYLNPPTSLYIRGFTWGSTIRLAAAGLPLIPTIYNINLQQGAHLSKYVEAVGGFPVILKSSGSSHGQAVMRVDSIESLKSVIDYVSDTRTSDLVLKKYIKEARHIRCVVLNNKVVDAIEYFSQKDDFRTNAVDTPNVSPIPDDPALFEIAQKSVSSLGLEFGGVDLLIDTDGNTYIAEVNFPCNFARNQMSSGTDIAGMMVDHLAEKATTLV